ncbi:hypothetical protein [Nannocystis pusilla]|uniref:hypothetical protein n=1 Tax=Nannocystis pusilla TaxID=889268 RepID=UPI003DA61496
MSVVGRAGVRRVDVGGEVTALAVGENDMVALRGDGEMWRWRGLSGEAWQESWPGATAVAVSAEARVRPAARRAGELPGTP